MNDNGTHLQEENLMMYVHSILQVTILCNIILYCILIAKQNINAIKPVKTNSSCSPIYL